MANLFASGSDPYVQWQPSEASGVQHTDQEVTDGSGNSHMYRTYNAEYNSSPSQWITLTAGVSNAYATVQNPDGSVHYYWNGGLSPWTSWLGSGNNAVYNAVDYGLVAGSVGSAIQVANVAAIQNAVNDIILNRGALGGTVLIPAGTYWLSGTVNIENMDTSGTGGIVIRGESNATTLFQQGNSSGDATDTFDLQNDENPSVWGVRFRDLTIQYKRGLNIPPAGAVAINCIAGMADTTAEDCAFVNCPRAFAAGSSASALHCGLINCTVYQDEYKDSTQILLGGYECFATCCEIYQTPMVHGGPKGCTGIQVLSASGSLADGSRVYGCHISDFYTGISVQESAFTTITACEIDAAVALNVVPTSSSNRIYSVYATSCKFGMLLSYMPPTPTSGVYIDTNGGLNSNVEGIFIDNCLAYGYQNAGVQINSGQSIHINGGKYSGNGIAPASTISGAGVAITGSCSKVRVTGADCSGIFDFMSPPQTQPYAVTVANGAANILVANCDVTSNATGTIYVPTNGTDVRVVDCLGYNDQNTLVSSTAPASGTHFNGSYFGYYGPVTFYTNSVPNATITSIAIQGSSTDLLSGSFTIGAGLTPYAAVSYNSTGGSKPDFLVIGQ